MEGGDFVEFTIHPGRGRDGIMAGLRSDYLSAMSRHVVGYVWHDEPFRIDAAVEGRPYLTGRLSLGDNVEDEWFAIAILLELTKRFDDVVVRVTDQDGEVLLIETAEALPRWAQDPSVADGRAFLHRGELHIVPVARTPAQVTPLPSGTPPDPVDAAEVVRRYRDTTRAGDGVQSALRSRLGRYPHDWSEFQHYAHYLVPDAVRRLVVRRPDLVPAAVGAFCSRDRRAERRLRLMERFGPGRRGGSVKVGLVLSKCLYSMLAKQRYRPDRRAGWSVPGDDDDGQAAKAFDLGVKLACGFEILAAASSSKRGDDRHQVEDGRFGAFLASLEGNGYFQGQMAGSSRYGGLLERAKSFYSGLASDLPVDDDPFDEDNDRLEEVDEEPTREPDDDSWMDFDHDTFDRMLEGHFRLGKDSGSGEEGIPREVKRFLGHVSNLEGVEVPEAEQREMSFDADGFEKAMRKVLNIEDGASSSESSDFEDDLEEDLVEPEMKAYLDAIDSELAMSNVLSTGDLDKPLDVDGSVLKNLLESFKSQDGMPGPASTLLQPLGIDLEAGHC